MNKSTLILDLDGVFISMSGAHQRNIEDFVKSLKMLDQWNYIPRNLLVATNRTPAEMQPIAYILGCTQGYWITENGGSIYDVKKEEILFPPEMDVFAQNYVPALRSYLSDSPSILIHHTSGYIRTIISCPFALTKELFVETLVRPLFEKFKYKESFEITISKVICIEPKSLSKVNALPLFFKLNELRPKIDHLFFIADNDRDIEIAQYLAQNNATIGAVGNSSSKFLDFVSHYSNGICAPLTTCYHSSLVFLLQAFNDLIVK